MMLRNAGGGCGWLRWVRGAGRPLPRSLRVDVAMTKLPQLRLSRTVVYSSIPKAVTPADDRTVATAPPSKLMFGARLGGEPSPRPRSATEIGTLDGARRHFGINATTQAAPPTSTQSSPSASSTFRPSAEDESEFNDESFRFSGVGGEVGAYDNYDRAASISGRKQLESLTEKFLDASLNPPGSLSLAAIHEASAAMDLWTRGELAAAPGTRSAAASGRAAALLERLIVERGSGRNPDVTWDVYRMDSIIYFHNSVLDSEPFLERIQSLIYTLEREYQLDDLEVPYKSIISALCSCRTGKTAEAAEWILCRVEDRQSISPDGKVGGSYIDPLSVETYNSVISCWMYARDDRRWAQRASGVLQRLWDIHQSESSSAAGGQYATADDFSLRSCQRIGINHLGFNMVITSLSKTEYDLENVGRQCYEWFRCMVQLHDDGHHDCAPDIVTFATVLIVLARNDGDGDDRRAKEILEMMLRISGNGTENHDGNALNRIPRLHDHDRMPETKHFNLVLSAMAGSRRVDGATLEEARRLVGIMEKLAKQKGSSFPDTITYNTLVSIAGRTGRPDVAEEILNEMIERSANGETNLNPDRTTFNTVLTAWMKSKKRNATTRMTELLHRMQEMAENGNTDVKPDKVSLTALITALIGSLKFRGDSVNVLTQVETIIQRMQDNGDDLVKPDIVTYTSLIRCWGHSGHKKSASKVEAILEDLHKRYREGDVLAKPDTLCYNVCLDAIAKSKEPGGAQRAEKLLQRMQEYHDAGDVDLAPTSESFSTVIQAWARSGERDGALRAEELLQMLHDMQIAGNENLKPTTIAYSTCIFAWSNSGDIQAGERAEALLDQMHKSDDGPHNFKPNTITYTNAINAWTNSRHPQLMERVEILFDRMVDLTKAGNSDFAPTTITLNAVLGAIRRSSEPQKYLKARKAFHCMMVMNDSDEIRFRPDIRTYNEFISACAYTKGGLESKEAAFSTALNALLELRTNNQLRPDLYTWPAIWKACENLLLVKNDMKRINTLFNLTIRGGCINEHLFQNMRNFLPPKYLQKKLNTSRNVWELTAHDLPEEWTRNVRLRPNKQRNSSAKKKERKHQS